MRIPDANNSSVPVNGTIDLVVNKRGSVETFRFKVVKRLVTQLILGCDYCDKHVESIHSTHRIVKLTDAKTVPFIRKPAPRAKDAIKLSEKQE